ncbi:MAG: cytochrome c [Myxococcales bacterium]|nr:cytochrome c [Myxococcales bacterium]
MGKTLVLSLMVGMLAFASACSKGGTTTALNVEDFDYPLASRDAAAGEQVYETFCEGCHPGGMEGDGPEIVGAMLTRAQMRWRVRNGGDDMPAFDEGKISKTELDDLLAFTAGFQAVSLGQ